MAVDRGYGSGKPRSAANSSMRRRVAAGKLTKGKVSVLAKRNAAAAPSMARDKYNEKTASGLARGVTDLTGFNARDGVDLGDIAALGLMIPAGVAGGVARAASRLLPKGIRISSAANRIATKALEASESQVLRSKLYKDMGSNKLRSLTERKKFEGQFLKLSEEASEKAFISAGRKNVARNQAVIKRRLAALQRANRNR